MPSARIVIVIVNYRTPGLVVECLRSLEPQVLEWAGARVVVVDGGSGDGSAEALAAAIREQSWGGWVDLLPLADNRGFAAGNNAAIKPLLHGPTPPDYVLLLNPDTVVRPGSLRALIDFMESHPTAGIAGSRLEDPDGTPQRSAFRFPSVASELDGGLRLGLVTKLLRRFVVAPPVRDDCHPTDWVAGASMIVRRAVFERVGVFDEGYFLYFEETDFCLAAARAGWPCWYAPASRVVHLVGQSSGVTNPNRPPDRLPAYWFHSRRRYFRKNHGWVVNRLADLAWLTGHVLWRARSLVQPKRQPGPAHLLRDFVRHNFLTAR